MCVCVFVCVWCVRVCARVCECVCVWGGGGLCARARARDYITGVIIYEGFPFAVLYMIVIL